MTQKKHSFQLLEINVSSAQDLAPVSKSMRTYVVLWLNPDRKLTTRIDQVGHTNPKWNEKFAFRVDKTFLESENSCIMIEIYAAAWLRDVQIGSVNVLINDIFPANYNNTKTRHVALQVRRPSGRPQGILNLGVQLLDSTMRSMPLSTELSEPVSGFTQKNRAAQLRRTRSETTTDLSMNDDYGGDGVGGGSLVKATAIMKAKNNNVMKNKDYNVNNGNGSNVNGSLCSDLGPSASVVAAAIAKGLIKTPANVAPRNAGHAGSSIVDDWTENNSMEGLRTKIERWRTELPHPYDPHEDRQKLKSRSRRRNHQRREPERDSQGLFSCFGNVFGCEISITCGGGRKKKRHGNRKVFHASSIESQYT